MSNVNVSTSADTNNLGSLSLVAGPRPATPAVSGVRMTRRARFRNTDPRPPLHASAADVCQVVFFWGDWEVGNIHTL